MINFLKLPCLKSKKSLLATKKKYQQLKTHVVWLSNVVAALYVLDDLVDLRPAAGEGNPAGLPRAHGGRGAVEVDVAVPVAGALDAAALELEIIMIRAVKWRITLSMFEKRESFVIA